MHTHIYITLITISSIALSLFGATACNVKESGEFYINMYHVVQKENLQPEDKIYHAASGHGYKVYRLKYYLSQIILEDDKGESLSIDVVHLFDILTPKTLKFKVGKIPVSNYTRLSFIFGLGKEKNVEGGLENTLQNNNMEWPIIGEKGYHYMKFEGKYDSLHTGIMKNYHIHTGPTGNNANFITIDLPLPKPIKEQSDLIVKMEMDIHKLLHGPHDYDFTEFDHGIMDNQNAQEILKENGGDIFRIVSVNE